MTRYLNVQWASKVCEAYEKSTRETDQDGLRRSFDAFADHSGAIGRRYRRQDEIGTPYAVTVDHQSIEDGTVTLRERDSMKQKRVSIDELESVLSDSTSFP